MTKASDYLENAFLNHVLRGNVGATAMAQPSGAYLALHIADPTEDATGAELTGGSYERQLVEFDEPIDGVAINSSEVIFSGLPTGTVKFLAFWDALENGNMTFYSDEIIPNITLNANDEITIAAGIISISLD